ncbi:transposase [Kitasatospora nipponensis]|uniref:transposase n=1 Tax=Kitasatospora nipponensis TaxID=258049 RepID=UPI003CD0BDEE
MAPASEPSHYAIGRSRGGLTTKVRLAADGHCRPLCFVLAPGQASDAPAFEYVMAALRVPRQVGRPRTWPHVVLADRAYSSRAIREHLHKRSSRTVIPQPADQIANSKHRGRSGSRPTAFNREAYKQRNTVERCINPEELARPGYPLRDDRHRIPGGVPHRGHLHLVRTLIQEAVPSRSSPRRGPRDRRASPPAPTPHRPPTGGTHQAPAA